MYVPGEEKLTGQINTQSNMQDSIEQQKDKMQFDNAGLDESIEIISDEEVDKYQTTQKKVDSAQAQRAFATDIDLLGKDFYRNPYLVREKMNKDTVKLGSKTWKPNPAQRVKNRRIDAAKAISKKATAYTLNIYNSINEVTNAHAAKSKSLDSSNIFAPNVVDYSPYESCSQVLSTVHFTAKMFTSAYIAKHFRDCYEIVDSFKRMKALALSDTEHKSEIDELLKDSEMYELFSKRVSEFAKKNHVDINTGQGTDESLTAQERITEEDLNRWLILTDEAKLQRSQERLNQALATTKNIEISEESIEKSKEEAAEIGYGEHITADISDFIEMSVEERISNIPLLKSSIEAIKKEIGPASPDLANIELRKELTHVKAMLRLAQAELKVYEARKKDAADDDALKNMYSEEVKELYAASEDIRKLKKRIDNELDNEKTVPKGIVKLSREEAMSTYSDSASMKKRLQILRVSEQMVKKNGANSNDISPDDEMAYRLNNLVKRYYKKNFYKVGDREESKALKKVLLFIQDNRLENKPRFAPLVKEIHSMTDGSLSFNEMNKPKDAKYLDMTGMRPEALSSEGMSPVFSKINSVLDTFTVWEDRRNEPLFAHEPTVNDLRQGKVSNCWMVSATAALINVNPQIIKDALKDNGDGTVTVRLFTREKNSATNSGHSVPNYIRVTKETPKLFTGGAVHTSGALWMHMLEKAAALIGYKASDKQNPLLGYNALWHGSQGNWLFALTGIYDDSICAQTGQTPGMIMNSTTAYKGLEGFTTLNGDFDVLKHDEKFLSELYNDILHAREKGLLYTYGSRRSDTKGLNSGHAYTVLGAKEVGGERYVILRNPYGNMNAMYDEKGKLSRTENYFCSSMNETYGQFMIKLSDFLEYGGIISRFDTKKYGHHEEIDKKEAEEKKKAIEEAKKRKEEKKKNQSEKVVDKSDPLLKDFVVADDEADLY